MDDQEYDKKIALMDNWADSLRKDLVSIITDYPSSIIYHYTDVNGLIGILGNGCIRATHVNRLNDASENKHGFEFVRDYVSKNSPNDSKPLIERVLSEFEAIDTYVARYSTKHDQLSQWRGYAGSQLGYSLGFDTSQMTTIDGALPLLEAVIYEEGKVKAVLNCLLGRVNDFFINNTFGEIETGYILGTVSSLLNIIACINKHPKFEEESEYRHIYQPHRSKLKLSRCFKAGRFGLTSYVEIKFLNQKVVPLVNITVGPCQDFDLEKKELEIFLHAQGYAGVEIIKSSIPLRT